MHIHGPSQIQGIHGVKGPHSSRAPGSTTHPTSAGPADQLDISPAADAAASAAEGDIRADLVARVRNEIANGTYETPEKLDTALSRLLNELG